MPKYTRDVDERSPKPPLTDDPEFLARLLELDEGVIEDPSAPVSVSHPLPVPRRSTARSSREPLTPEATAALAAASAALAVFDTGPAVNDQTDASVHRPPVDSVPPPVPAPAPSFRRGRLLIVVLMIALLVGVAVGAVWLFF
jgi:hypothetical protein